VSNFGKALGAGLEALGAGLIKQGETQGNMMYLTAAADKEYARKTAAAMLKGKRDTAHKYLESLGKLSESASKRYVALLKDVNASDEAKNEAYTQVRKAQSNLQAAWAAMGMGQAPKPPALEDYTAAIDYVMGSPLLQGQPLLTLVEMFGDDKDSKKGMNALRKHAEGMVENWDKLDKDGQTKLLIQFRDKILTIDPASIEIAQDPPKDTKKITRQFKASGGFHKPARASTDRLVKRDGVYYMDGHAISEEEGKRIENTFKKYKGYQYKVPETTSTLSEATTHEMGADSAASDVNQQAFKSMLNAGAGGMETFEENPAAAANGRWMARQNAQSQGAANVDQLQSEAISPPNQDVQIVKRFIDKLMELLQSMSREEAMQAMQQQYAALSAAQKQLIKADKNIGAFFQ